MNTYKTVIGNAVSQFTEKRSRFIGYVSHTENDDEAVAFIENIRAQNSDARHNVYAYVLKHENRMRYSDDGEPHGTAGKPILDIINGCELKDVTVVVTRYFGGILLGTGGLVRAYSKACKDVLETSEKCLIVPGNAFNIACEYSDYAKLEKLLHDFDATIDNVRFENNVSIDFSISQNNTDNFLLSLKEAFSSRISAEYIGERYAKQKI